MNKKKDKKLWGGRFSGSMAGITERISESISYESRLYRHDIKGSVAHAKMLNRMGILSSDEAKSIIDGLHQIEKEIDNNTFEFRTSLEDIHMNIESALTSRIGDIGKKLHTARSRNDQIALDMRLYLKEESGEIRKMLLKLISLLCSLADENINAIMPGYTHLQVAQPVRFSHHILVYAWQLIRDVKRLDNAFDSSDVMPLGVGSIAGVNYKNDREYLREELGFTGITANSMDTISDRDFILDFLYFASVLGMHFSRLCEELVLWSTSEFNFIRLSDGVTTGSSIMPQKRNPDVAELIRGKTGRLFGNFLSMLTSLKGLPLTYNRDLQEDKEPLFDSIDTIKLSIEGVYEMLSTMTLNKEEMAASVYSNFSTATDIADYLAKKGVPFRESHETTGNIVHYCEENNKDFFRLSAEELRSFSEHFTDDITEILNPETSPERKESAGSTSKNEIKKQIDSIREFLKEY